MAGHGGEQRSMKSNQTMTLSQDVTEKLTRQIISGRYPVGAKLPTERALALEFEVARHIIREALKRLEAIGLVRIRQGSGIYVRQMQFAAGVELFDILLFNEDGSMNMTFLGDVLEFREHMARQIVRLAVARHTPEEFEQMRALFEEAGKDPLDNDQREEILGRLYELVADATHNQVYRRMFYSISQVLVKLRRLFDVPMLPLENRKQIFGEVLAAFEKRDEEKGDQLMCLYMDMLDNSIKNNNQPRA